MAEIDGREAGADELRALALTNYGHFTTLRVEDGAARGLALHLERLRRDCFALFGAELDTGRVREWVRRTLPARGATTVRVTVFDPGLGLARPEQAAAPRVLVTRREAAGEALPPLRVRSVTYERDAPEVKSVALFGSLRQRRAARLAGYDDALFTDRRGRVSEGGTWNIGFVDAGGRVVWPEAECLEGVTMRLLRGAGACAPVPLSEAVRMEAAFATNAAFGVRPLASLDDREFPPTHPVLHDLTTRYAAIRPEPV
ncbi:aminotransferase class IV [Streptomyces sp. HNM0574]|uniref:aminotransferase class IV n=1 Tax=Streptomyces sp. HNM0574 TaxID=2714954 RepID=UPI00146D0BF3|nr:aminotransferase [Streptomyces sp. HNM0574]